MPSLPITQCRAYALLAGFIGDNLNTILAISQAESGLDPMATNRNSDGSLDRGILQINNRWHAEVSDTQAFNPGSAYVAGYRISSQGTDFTPWSTYNNGAYKKFLSTGTSGETTTYFAEHPDFNWIYQSPDLTLTYVPHWARDVQESTSWPLTSMVPGTVADLDDSGNVGGGIGCQVFIIPDAYPEYAGSVIKADWRPSDGGVDPQQPTNVDVIPQPQYGRLAWYSYHFLPGTAVVKNGDHVLAGQKLAMTSYYGHTAPETHAHVGWYYNWARNTDAGYRPYGPDILPFLNLVNNRQGNFSFGGAPPVGAGGVGTLGSGGIAVLTPLNDAFLAFSLRAHNTITHVPGFQGVVEAVDEAEQFIGIVNVGGTIPPPPPDTGIVGSVGSWIKNLGQGAVQTVQNPADSIGSAVGNAVQSVLQTIIGNALPLLIRTLLFLFGLVIILALINKLVAPIAKEVVPL